MSVLGGLGGGGGISPGTVLGNTAVSGFGGPLPKMALGGPVLAGVAYEVGERGRELFVPKVAGTIIPNHALGGGGGEQQSTVNVAYNIATPDANSFRISERQLVRLTRRRFKI